MKTHTDLTLANEMAKGWKYTKPGSLWNAEAQEKARKAAEAHAKANPTDPFAYPRIMLHMRQGYEIISDVQADADRVLQQREMAKREALARAQAG